MIVSYRIIFFCTIILLSCAANSRNESSVISSVTGFQTIAIIGPSIEGTKSLKRPQDIAVSKMGDIYIADYGNDRIVRLNQEYKFIAEVGGFGLSEYSLNGPSRLALDNAANLYLLDSGNKRVVRLDRNLNFIASDYSYTGDSKIQFSNPTAIDLSMRGDLFIGDEGLGTCLRLDQFFNYSDEFGDRNSVHPLLYPEDIEYDEKGKVYIADSRGSSVEIYDDFGLHLYTIGSDYLSRPVAVAIAPTVGVIVSDSDSRSIYVFDKSGNFVFRYNGDALRAISQPAGITVDSRGNIYIVDSGASVIYILKPFFE